MLRLEPKWLRGTHIVQSSGPTPVRVLELELWSCNVSISTGHFWEIIHESQDAEFCILMLPLFNSPHHRYTPGLDLGGNPSDALLVF